MPWVRPPASGRGSVQRRGHGSLPVSSSASTSLQTSISSTRISLPRQLPHSGTLTSSFRDPHFRLPLWMWRAPSPSILQTWLLWNEPQFNISASAGLFFFWHTLQNNQLLGQMCIWSLRGEFLPACNNYCFRCLMSHKLATAEVKSRF